MIQEEIAEQLFAAGGRWSQRLEQLHGRIAHIASPAQRPENGSVAICRGCSGGSSVRTAGSWPRLSEMDPQGVQRLLNSAKWDADLVRDDLREYAVEHLGDEVSGVLIVDESGFLKKGEKSVGVAPQYTGTAGDTVNCQVGVFLAYSSKKGAAFIDRALYLPWEWAHDKDRRTEAGVPEEVSFADKLRLAKLMLKRAFEAGVPAGWVVADSFYGRSHDFRGWLEERGRPYAVMVPKTNAVHYRRGHRKKIEQLVERLPEDAWALAAPAGESPDGRYPWEWACLELCGEPEKRMGRWLLARRSSEDTEDVAFYQLYGPEETSPAKLVDVCHNRWKVEDCFAEVKGEVGLDHYEVRRWDAWHRYVTLCLLAHAFLVVTCSAVRQEEEVAAKAAKKGILSRI